MTSSEQARADAMADAETLRRVVTAHDVRGYALPLERRSPILKAAKYGSDAGFFMRHNHDPIDEPGQFAISAARAAFRACPGLR